MNIFIDLEMQNMRNAAAEIRKVCCREVIEIGAVALDDTGEQRGSVWTGSDRSSDMKKNLLPLAA